MVGSNIVYGEVPGFDGDFPAYILNIEDAEDVYENNQYKVRDLYFTGKEGFVNWTLSITNLKPKGQTRGHSHPDAVELCRIMSGEAFIYLDGVSWRVKAGSFIMIGKTVHHKVVNASETTECVFTSDFPGHLVRDSFVRKKR